MSDHVSRSLVFVTQETESREWVRFSHDCRHEIAALLSHALDAASVVQIIEVMSTLLDVDNEDDTVRASGERSPLAHTHMPCLPRPVPHTRTHLQSTHPMLLALAHAATHAHRHATTQAHRHLVPMGGSMIQILLWIATAGSARIDARASRRACPLWWSQQQHNLSNVLVQIARNVDLRP